MNSPPLTPPDRFTEALESWKLAARGLNDAEQAFATAQAKAIQIVDGKNAAMRQARAEQLIAQERSDRDTARIEEQAARWTVEYELARLSSGRSEPRTASSSS